MLHQNNVVCLFVCLFSWRYKPLWLYFHSPVAGFSLLVFVRFLDHTQRSATVGRTPLDEGSARRRDLYLTTHNTHNRQTSTSPVGFETTISAGERPQTDVLDRAAIGTGTNRLQGDEIRGGGVGWERSMHGRYEKFMLNFSRKICRKRTTWKTRHRWRDIRMVLRVNGM
jgi:hypothetical protein